jgi:hypothetical protein
MWVGETRQRACLEANNTNAEAMRRANIADGGQG